MKKMKCILMGVLIFLLSGCTNYDMSMTFEEDKSMDFKVVITATEENIITEEQINDYQEKYEKHGYIIKKYNKDNKNGIEISKHFDNIDDISLGKRSDEFNLLYLYEEDYNESKEKLMFNVDKGIDTNRYAANFYVNLTNLGIDLNKATITYKVFLPNGSVSNNANQVSSDGKELTWNITSSGKTEIDYVFELRSYEYIYYTIAVIVVIFLVFTIFGSIFGANSKGSTNKRVSDNNDIEKKIDNITKNAINKTKKGINNHANNDKKIVNMDKKNNGEQRILTVNVDNITVTKGKEKNINEVKIMPEVTQKPSLMEMFETNADNNGTNKNVQMQNNITKEVDPNLDINRPNTVDSFEYSDNDIIEDDFNKEEAKERLESSIIRVNNKDIVVNRKSKEDE